MQLKTNLNFVAVQDFKNKVIKAAIMWQSDSRQYLECWGLYFLWLELFKWPYFLPSYLGIEAFFSDHMQQKSCLQMWWWNSLGSWQNSINNVMEDHSPKLPSDFGCFYFKMPTWIMLDMTSCVAECLSVLGIHFGYISEIQISYTFLWRL